MALRILPHLDDDKKAAIASMGLRWLTHMPHISENHRLLTTLAKQWHKKHTTFHLPTGEATITFKDVYHILQVPCHGDPVSMIIRFWCSFVLSFWHPYEVYWCENLHVIGLLQSNPYRGETSSSTTISGCHYPGLPLELGEAYKWVWRWVSITLPSLFTSCPSSGHYQGLEGLPTGMGSIGSRRDCMV